MTSEISGTPEFKFALGRYLAAVHVFGEHSPHARAAMLKVLELAPPSFLEQAERVLKAHGARIKPRGYLPDGAPLLDPTDIAAALGLNPEEGEKSWREFLAAREAAGLETPSHPVGAVHRVQ